MAKGSEIWAEHTFSHLENQRPRQPEDSLSHEDNLDTTGRIVLVNIFKIGKLWLFIKMFYERFIAINLCVCIFLCMSTGCSQKICKVDSGTKGSYTIRGKKYRPLKKVPHNFAQKGTASWYGPGFQGRKTASGEVYNMHALTAAHCTLPLDTLLKVTNLRNNREVIVRVNDRGPFVGDRMLDLSKAAADHLGMLKEGLAPVRIAVLPDPKPWHSTSKLANAKAKAKIMAPNPFFGRASRISRLAKKI